MAEIEAEIERNYQESLLELEKYTKLNLVKLFCINFLWYFFATYGFVYFIKNTIDKFNLIPVIAKTIVWFQNL